MNYNIKETDRAYFAGLFDGEGCVYIGKSKIGKYISYGLKVKFGITYKSVLLRIQKLFGGNIYERDMEKQKSMPCVIKRTGITPDNWKQEYHYQLNGRNALYFLKVIEPFCDEKKQQVSLGIRYEEGKRTNIGKAGRSKHETERSEFFYQELRRLKKEQPSEDKPEDEIGFEDDQKNLFSFVEDI